MYYNYYRMFKSRGEEQPGISVFYKDETGDDTIYDTHSSYARGGDLLIWHVQLPRPHALQQRPQEINPSHTDWVRYHDQI